MEGNYACGLVRDAVADQLLQEGDNFADTDCLTSLPHFIKNKSITGFMIEHAVLSSIRSERFSYWQKHWEKHASETPQGTHELRQPSRISRCFIGPEICNFPAIDAMIVLIKPKEKKGGQAKVVDVTHSDHSESPRSRGFSCGIR